MRPIRATWNARGRAKCVPFVLLLCTHLHCIWTLESGSVHLTLLHLPLVLQRQVCSKARRSCRRILKTCRRGCAQWWRGGATARTSRCSSLSARARKTRPCSCGSRRAHRQQPCAACLLDFDVAHCLLGRMRYQAACRQHRLRLIALELSDLASGDLVPYLLLATSVQTQRAHCVLRIRDRCLQRARRRRRPLAASAWYLQCGRRAHGQPLSLPRRAAAHVCSRHRQRRWRRVSSCAPTSSARCRIPPVAAAAEAVTHH